MLVGFGIVLLVAGAILNFAVDAQVDNVDLAAVGWILMAAGAGSILAGAIRGASWMSSRNTQFKHERHVSADGQHVVEETKTK